MRVRGWVWLISMWVVLAPVCWGQVVLTSVVDTVYRADGVVAAGEVVISWPAFTTAAGVAVPAGSTTVVLGVGGVLSVSLAPNAGAMPVGTAYSAVYHLVGAAVSRETWVVPMSAVAVRLSAVRAQVLPSSVAMQTVTKGYVDAAIAAAVTGVPVGSQYVLKAGDTMTGALVLPGDPTASLQAVDKQYVDTLLANLQASGSFTTLTAAGGVLSGVTVDGVSPGTMGHVDATSSIQTQLNGKQVAFGSQTANAFYAGPSGVMGAPSFRAIVASDLTGALAAPGPIGGTTPGSAAVTLLQAQGDIAATSTLFDWVTSTNATGTVTMPAARALSTSGITAGFACSFVRSIYGGSGTNYTGVAACADTTTAFDVYISGPHAAGAESWVRTFSTSTSSGVMTGYSVVGSNIKAGENVVAYAATPTFSAAYQSNVMTLTGNVTSFTLAAGMAGQQVCLMFVQDATGGRTVAAPSNVRGFFTVGTTASKASQQCFTYSGSLVAWVAQSAGAVNF